MWSSAEDGRAPGALTQALHARSLLREVVFVDFLDLVGRAGAHADIVPNHEPRQFRAVDQDEALADVADIVAGTLAEGGSADEDAFGRPTPSRLSAKLCTSERPAVLPSAYRLAWT